MTDTNDFPFCIPRCKTFGVDAKFIDPIDPKQAPDSIPSDVLTILRKLVDGREGLCIYNAGVLFDRIKSAMRCELMYLFEYEIDQTEQEKLKAWFDESGYKYKGYKRRLCDTIYDYIKARNKFKVK